MLDRLKIGVLGAGNMGEALISGLVKASLVEAKQLMASRRSEVALAYLADTYGIRTTTDNCELVLENDIIILAAKPQILPSILEDTELCFRPGQVVITVAAGISTAFVESWVKNDIPVIRVMPNTPALVGQAMSPYCLGRHGSAVQALVAAQIFSAVGVTTQVEEEMLDAITALSGSGPAYFFYLLEGLIEAGVSMGLPEHLSRALVRQTCYGAAKLVVETTRTPQQLRAQVTSPQGTTHAAISFLEQVSTKELIKQAVLKAKERAHELGAGVPKPHLD